MLTAKVNGAAALDAGSKHSSSTPPATPTSTESAPRGQPTASEAMPPPPAVSPPGGRHLSQGAKAAALGGGQASLALNGEKEAGAAGAAHSQRGGAVKEEPEVEVDQSGHQRPERERGGGERREDEVESRSSDAEGEGMSGDGGGEEDEGHPRKKGKRYHRHTSRQIAEMEQLFKECPHPDESQRLELSRSLGLEPRQVKFWFQNRRTQMKAHGERYENQQLRGENERVRAENAALRDALARATCPQCGSAPVGGGGAPPEMHREAVRLADENGRLKLELERVLMAARASLAVSAGLSGLSGVAIEDIVPGGSAPLLQPSVAERNSSLVLLPSIAKGMQMDLEHSPPSQSPSSRSQAAGDLASQVLTRPSQGQLSDTEKNLVYDLAMVAMDELVQMAQAEEPLWARGRGAAGGDALSRAEYQRLFPRRHGHPLLGAGCSHEASRAAGLVASSAAALVEVFLDSERFVEMFPDMVARAVTVDTVSEGGGVGKRDGALKLIYAESQVLSPLVPTREAFFLRFCRLISDGCWGVADISADSLRSDPPPVMLRCRRRASGVLVREAPGGGAHVVWVEHQEVDDRDMHRLFRPHVRQGAAFGAATWLAALQRQCARQAAFFGAVSLRDSGMVVPEGRRSLMRLAQRMTANFCSGVSASTQHTWTTLSGGAGEEIRVMTRKSLDNPGEPSGVILSAATSLWVPVGPQQGFEFLRAERSRSEWDILASGGLVSEMGHICTGDGNANCISLLKVQAPSTGQNNMLILQETCANLWGYSIYYAPVDIAAMQQIIVGGEPERVAMLPSGFTIVADAAGSPAERREMLGLGGDGRPPEGSDAGIAHGGSILTVAFQILVSNTTEAKLSLESVATVNNLIECTVQRIRSALQRGP